MITSFRVVYLYNKFSSKLSNKIIFQNRFSTRQSNNYLRDDCLGHRHQTVWGRGYQLKRIMTGKYGNAFLGYGGVDLIKR